MQALSQLDYVSGISGSYMLKFYITVAGLGTLVMGIVGGVPIIMAPGMGMNALFAFELCGLVGYRWQTGLGILFLAGLGELILVVSFLICEATFISFLTCSRLLD